MKGIKTHRGRGGKAGGECQCKNDSLQHFIEAFDIFKHYFEGEKLDALQTAEAAMQISCKAR